MNRMVHSYKITVSVYSALGSDEIGGMLGHIDDILVKSLPDKTGMEVVKVKHQYTCLEK